MDPTAAVAAAGQGDGDSGEPVEASQTTRPVLEGVSVLAVGAEYRRSEIQKNEAYGTVTLLVSMEEAATLIFVRDFYKAALTLILRSNEYPTD